MYLKPNLIISILLCLLPVSFLLAVALGAVSLPLIETLKAIVGIIVTHLRMPRALLAACVGALLGISGATTQGLFRNPLADPSLIGVTSGAIVGASIVIVLGGAILPAYWGVSLVSFGAFIGGALAVIIVYRLATSAMGTSVATMLLAGIAITALAGSFNNFLEFIASNEMLRRISLWKMGGLDGANYSRVAIAVVITALSIIVLPRHAPALNAMLLGESEAKHLGINVRQLKRVLILLVAAGVGASVALAGTIAFVGLIVPHVMRLLGGPDHRYLLPASALGGAILLMLADVLARVLIAPTELPVGMLTAVIGAPFFIYLLVKKDNYGGL